MYDFEFTKKLTGLFFLYWSASLTTFGVGQEVDGWVKVEHSIMIDRKINCCRLKHLKPRAIRASW